MGHKICHKEPPGPKPPILSLVERDEDIMEIQGYPPNTTPSKK